MTSEIDNVMRCPHCGGRDVRPSHIKSALDHVLEAAFHRKPFRCRACGRRFRRHVIMYQCDVARTSPQA